MNHSRNLSEALEQISDIHQHLAHSQVYRGFRSVPIAMSGAIGLIAAVVQPHLVAANSPDAFVRYWLIVAGICAAVGAAEIVFNYIVREKRLSRRQTFHAAGQFAPAVVAAAGITALLWRIHQHMELLPGLWAMLFGLAMFASRPLLPRAIGWVALFYLCAGWWLIAHSNEPTAFSGWRVGGVFGFGQLASALVLYWNLERRNSIYAEPED